MADLGAIGSIIPLYGPLSIVSTAHTPYSISGVISDSLGNPTQRKVIAVSRPTNGDAAVVLAQTLSDAVTGAYTLEGALWPEGEVARIVISEDDAAPLLNDLIDRVIPG